MESLRPRVALTKALVAPWACDAPWACTIAQTAISVAAATISTATLAATAIASTGNSTAAGNASGAAAGTAADARALDARRVCRSVSDATTRRPPPDAVHAAPAKQRAQPPGNWVRRHPRRVARARARAAPCSPREAPRA